MLLFFTHFNDILIFYWKAIAETLLLIALIFYLDKTNYPFYYKHNRVSFTSVEISCFRPTLRGKHYFRHQNNVVPIDDIHG